MWAASSQRVSSSHRRSRDHHQAVAGVIAEERVVHPSPRCVVELRTTRVDGSPGLGTGYLVSDGWVLTAAHVVAGMSSVRVWVDPPATLSVQDESSVDTAGIVR